MGDISSWQAYVKWANSYELRKEMAREQLSKVTAKQHATL